MGGLRLAPFRIMSKFLLLTAGSVFAVLWLYKVAPCWTFEPFLTPIRPFYSIVWPALIPTLLMLFLLSGFEVFRGRWVWLLRSMWAGVMLAIAYGWWESYISTYIWWRSSGAPWPQFC